MTATAIGAHSSMHKTKVSRAVAELERRGWLTRKPDAADRRVEHLALTKAGRGVYGELVPLAKAFEAKLVGANAKVEREGSCCAGICGAGRTLDLRIEPVDSKMT